MHSFLEQSRDSRGAVGSLSLLEASFPSVKPVHSFSEQSRDSRGAVGSLSLLETDFPAEKAVRSCFSFGKTRAFIFRTIT